MKRVQWWLWVLLVVCSMFLLFGGCQTADVASEPRVSPPDIVEIHEWPENQYTSLVPKPPMGTPFWMAMDDKQQYCALSFTGGTRREVLAYIETLKKTGFVAVASSETPEDETDIVNFAGLSDQAYVTVSYSGGNFGLFISTNRNGVTSIFF